MKKLTLMATVTLLTLAGIGSHSLSADAAGARYSSSVKCGNKIIFSYINLGNMNCFPGIQLPENCLPGLPEVEKPENNCPSTPETEKPETPDSNVPSIPEVEKPDNNRPSIPETEAPDNNRPGSPETDKPDNKPEIESPDSKPDNDTPGQENLSLAEQVVELVNAERAKEGLAPLTIDEKVQAAAQVRAVESKTSFSHTRPNGSSFATALKEQGVTYRRAGENIAWGQRSPEEVVNAWMNSSGHRANIMNENFTKIGVGYYQHNGVNYWSQLFIG